MTSSGSKNLQIDISTLSEDQKKFYVQLLARSNLEFQKKDNKFVAQFKVDTSRLSTKPPKPVEEPKPKVKNVNRKKEDGKKLLQRTVKIGSLTKFESLHKNIQVYIYPKRMSLQLLSEFIESAYEKFWNENKKKSESMKDISFPEWLYSFITYTQKQKIKIQQLIVNLIDSLNHFRQKYKGIEIFYNFLSERYSISVFFYFLVLRGLLQQVTNEKIAQKSNNANTILGFRIRHNPHDRDISQQQVATFLTNLFQEDIQTYQKRRPIEDLFKNITAFMYFDQIKKKNYISFYELVDILVEEFIQSDVSSCEMSISKTQIEHPQDSLSQLITDENSIFQHRKPQYTNQMNDYVLQMKKQEEDQRNYNMRQSIQREVQPTELLRQKVMEKVEAMCKKLNCTISEELQKGVQTICQAICLLDKSIWLRYRGQISDAELLAIQKLQRQYKNGDERQLSSSKVSKSILLMPAIRCLITRQIKL